MILPLLHTITGALIVLCFTGKVMIHYYLDRMNNRAVGIGYILVNPLPYFLLYKSETEERFITLRNVCNKLLGFTAINLVLNIILGVLIYFL